MFRRLSAAIEGVAAIALIGVLSIACTNGLQDRTEEEIIATSFAQATARAEAPTATARPLAIPPTTESPTAEPPTAMPPTVTPTASIAPTAVPPTVVPPTATPLPVLAPGSEILEFFSNPAQFDLTGGRFTIDPGTVNWEQLDNDGSLAGIYLRFADLESFSESHFGDYLKLCNDGSFASEMQSDFLVGTWSIEGSTLIFQAGVGGGACG